MTEKPLGISETLADLPLSRRHESKCRVKSFGVIHVHTANQIGRVHVDYNDNRVFARDAGENLSLPLVGLSLVARNFGESRLPYS